MTTHSSVGRAWLVMAVQSAWSRRAPLGLVVAAIAVSVFLILSVAQLRQDARASFSHAVSGVDLIVGSRASPTELMLYSVFHLGRPTRNMSFDQYEEIVRLPQVKWAVPLQMGDSYRGYPVVGTTSMFFSRGVLGPKGAVDPQAAFVSGHVFSRVFDVVLGSDLARALGHKTGDKIILTHGKSDGLAADHSDTPFSVTGILRSTGTPIDRSLMISLAGFEAMHIGWEFGTPPKSPAQGLDVLHDRQTEGRRLDPKQLQPTQVTAVLVGLESRAQVFSARRAIEAMKGGSLMAVLPGVTLDELWQILSTVESTLSLMAWLVALSALLGVSATLLIALDTRRRELAILRAVGASARTILCFILLESLLVCVAGILVGWLSVQLGLLGFSGVLQQEFGIVLQHRLPDAEAWIAIAGIIGFSVVASAIPAWRAFRYSVHDGLHPPSI